MDILVVDDDLTTRKMLRFVLEQQAGAIDPGKAAVAAIGGGTTGSGTVDLPTFKVARVSAAPGECRK